MDSNVGAVVAEVGQAIVQAMVSDAWSVLRPKLVRFLRRGGADHLVAAADADRAAIDSGQLSVDAAAGRWAGRLELLVHQLPELQAEVSALAEELRLEAPAARPSVRQTLTGSRNQATAAGRDVTNSNNRNSNNRKTSFGGIGIVVAVIAVLLLGGGVLINNVIAPAFRDSSEAIDADTSCGDFLQFPTSVRDQAAKRIAVEMGVSGAGHPWLLNNVDYSCGLNPETALGDVVARQDY